MACYPELKPTDVWDNTGCIALANSMHLHGRSKHIALRVCFIQKFIQDELINVKQRPTAPQIADIGTKALPRVPFESFTDQLLGDKHVGDKRFIIRPFLSHVCMLSSLIWFGRVDYFLFSCSYLAVRLHGCSLWAVWLLSKRGNAHCFSNYDYLLFLNLFSTHAFRSYISHAWLWWWYEWGEMSESDRDTGMCDCSSL